jgi:hypothetical protein
MWKLKNTANTPPKGFRWIDPITNMEVHAQNFDNWMTKATDHRVANALPLVEREEMEDQLCRGYTENMRKDVCSEYDSSGMLGLHQAGRAHGFMGTGRLRGEHA